MIDMRPIHSLQAMHQMRITFQFALTELRSFTPDLAQALIRFILFHRLMSSSTPFSLIKTVVTAIGVVLTGSARYSAFLGSQSLKPPKDND